MRQAHGDRDPLCGYLWPLPFRTFKLTSCQGHMVISIFRINRWFRYSYNSFNKHNSFTLWSVFSSRHLKQLNARWMYSAVWVENVLWVWFALFIRTGKSVLWGLPIFLCVRSFYAVQSISQSAILSVEPVLTAHIDLFAPSSAVNIRRYKSKCPTGICVHKIVYRIWLYQCSFCNYPSEDRGLWLVEYRCFPTYDTFDVRR